MAENEQWDIVSSVGLTALGVAVARALETRSEDGLVDDPFAERFVRAAQPDGQFTAALDDTTTDQDIEQLWNAMSTHLGVRSRFFDEHFERAWSAGVRQAVILASGLDARAQRLDWPDDFQVFEIDQPLVIDFKDRVLAEDGITTRCKRHAVRADLREDWPNALLAAGFDAELPTAWLAEGLLPYLPPEAERELTRSITRLSAPGSRIGLEHAIQFAAALDDPSFERLSERFGVDLRQLVHTDDRTPALTRLADQGWTSDQNEDGSTLAARYGRTITGPGSSFLDRVHYATAHLG